MIKQSENKPEIKLIGLTARTNTKNEWNPQTAKIGELVTRYWEEDIASQIPNRKNSGVTLCVYTEYESNEHGDYTYFIGEEVESFEDMPANMKKLVIPAAKYQKFTTPPAEMPEVVIDAWREIWGMSAAELGGERAYVADFEVYDERASDPASTSLDIFIGIK